MDEERKFSMMELEQRPYRYLQQLAKSMRLPSNVKKVYLIQLIYAQQNCSQMEVDSIVQRIKMERQISALSSKKNACKSMRLQNTEISSTNNTCSSPPISQTPKRTGIIIQCSPNVECLAYPTDLVPRTSPRNRGSDRVLRSFNTKTYKRPNYCMMNDTIIGVVKSERDKHTEINIISSDGKYPKINLAARCILKKRQSIMNNLNGRMCDNQMVHIANVAPRPVVVPIKRQRALSGIYTINSQASQHYKIVQSVGFRRDDGKISKINALVQKSTQTLKRYENSRKLHQSILNSSQGQRSYQESLKNCQESLKNFRERHVIYQETRTNERNYQDEQSNHKESLKDYQEIQICHRDKRNYLEPKNSRKETKVYQEDTRNYQNELKIYLDQRNCQEVPKIYQEDQKTYQEDQKIFQEEQKTYQEDEKTYQEDHENEDIRSEIHNIEVTIQDIINSNIEAQTFSSPITEYIMTDSNINYPNMSGLTDVLPNATSHVYRENDERFSVYYHKKIRAEQVRNQRHVKEVPRTVELPLPKINEVFSNFSGIPSVVTQPLYVQVSSEAERLQSQRMQVPAQAQAHAMLESLYNFRSGLLTSAPLLPVPTTCNTRCVFSTPLIATAMQQPTSIVPNDQSFMSSFEQDNQYPCTSDGVSRMSDFLTLADQEITLRKCHEALSTSNSSLETQELGASVTIPEMVEDALELISQDGDYMERIGMDVRMQCILCSWAGPKIILEQHIRKEHSDKIIKQNSNEWNITYMLGTLVKQQQWLSQVSEFESVLYILSVKYLDPECFMAALSTVSHDTETRAGSMTIYNKVTGEPHTWHDNILQLPTNMPYHFDANHLQLELSSLNLLPNSANLKLLNRELVIKSPSKVVVGQPELNDIQIIIFVKIFT